MRKWIAALVVGALVLGGTAFWGYQQHQARARMETALANNYNRAFYNTLDHVQNLEVLLAKSLVAADRRQDDRIFGEIWQQSNAALDNLTQLPVSEVLVARTAKFLTQLGDFTRGLGNNATEGKTLTGEQYEQLKKLYRQAGDLNRELLKVESEITRGKISFRQMAGRTREELGQEGRQLAGASFRTVDEKMNQYPTLIYDGPFSDHLENREPQGTGREKVNEAAARSRALAYVDKKKGVKYVAQVTGQVEGNIPAYRVELTPRRNGKVTGEPSIVDVSRRGGKVIWSVTPREVGDARLSVEEGRQKARRFLEERGYKNMVASYYRKHDNVVTYNFVPRQENAIIYPDMVKVAVALDNGEVVSTDARGYLMSHRDRDLPKPKLSAGEARALLSRGLKVEGKGRLALIPTETYAEKLTWEFKGTMGGNTFLVYINALNGQEERILQMFESENGTLTM